MRNKPSRTFVYLALAMVFLFVIGMLVVGMLLGKNQSPSPFELTATIVVYGQPTTVALIRATQSQLAIESQPFTPIPYDASMSPTALPNFSPVPTSTPTLTFTPLAYPACVWNWARQPLPEVGMMALQAFIEADMTQVAVRAEAYGENCLDGTTNTVNYFAAMTTDFYAEVPVDDLSDEEELADLVIKIYQILAALPEDKLPARLGYLDITFSPPGQPVKPFRAMFDQIERALEEGLSGGELLEELGWLS